jgi:hypothetical protein
MNAMFDEDLSRLCDASGKPVGEGYKQCPKCNSYLCFMCKLILQNTSKEFPAKCPMRDGAFEN